VRDAVHENTIIAALKATAAQISAELRRAPLRTSLAQAPVSAARDGKSAARRTRHGR
jgi:hypothetical protein